MSRNLIAAAMVAVASERRSPAMEAAVRTHARSSSASSPAHQRSTAHPLIAPTHTLAKLPSRMTYYVYVWPPNGTRGCAGGERIPPADLDVYMYTLCCLDLGLDLWLLCNFRDFLGINLHAFCMILVLVKA